MDLTLTAQEEDFTGKWPTVMHIENAEYKCTLSYAGVGADPHSDVGEPSFLPSPSQSSSHDDGRAGMEDGAPRP